MAMIIGKFKAHTDGEIRHVKTSTGQKQISTLKAWTKVKARGRKDGETHAYTWYTLEIWGTHWLAEDLADVEKGEWLYVVGDHRQTGFFEGKDGFEKEGRVLSVVDFGRLAPIDLDGNKQQAKAEVKTEAQADFDDDIPF